MSNDLSSALNINDLILSKMINKEFKDKMVSLCKVRDMLCYAHVSETILVFWDLCCL